MSEGDESKRVEDNSLGRLLTLSDGVFAIAMTLLALDLKVPVHGVHATDSQLRQALRHNSDEYWAFLVSFYVVAIYWKRHRRLMRSVVTFHANLSRDTIGLLLVIAAMPFFSSLLGADGSIPFAFALYGAANALALLLLLVLAHDIRRFKLLDPRADPDDLSHSREVLATLAIFLLCIPGAYILKSHGPWMLALLAVPLRVPAFVKRWRTSETGTL